MEADQAIMLQDLNKKEAAVFMRLLHKVTVAVNELSRAPFRETVQAQASSQH